MMRMTNRKLRETAVRMLKANGIRLRNGASLEEISRAIAGKSINVRLTEFVGEWVDRQPMPPIENIVPPRKFDNMGRKPFMWRHPRSADIDSCQPVMITPDGVGSGPDGAGYIPHHTQW